MLDTAELVKKIKRHSFKKISIKILNDDTVELARAGSKCSMPFFHWKTGYYIIVSDFALLGPWNTVSVNQ